MHSNDHSDASDVSQQRTSAQSNEPVSAFKEAHMRYRRRPNDPNYTGDCHEMVDFGNPLNDERVLHFPAPSTSSTDDSFPGHDNNIYSGPLYGLVEYPGFLFAPNALSPNLQMLLAYAAVTTYCEFPHRTNFNETIPTGPHAPRSASSSALWDQWIRNNMTNGSLLKLSWSTVGYHYNWTRRSYNPDQQSPMPQELRLLASWFAITAHRRCGLGSSNTAFPYDATAGIVNYYHVRSVMGGHRDDLELALHQPIISVSVGRPAVFLFGGPNLHDFPVLPILVRPGDVVVFGGPCRLNYHSMARLLPYETIPLTDDCNSHQLQVEDLLEKGNVPLERLRHRLFSDPNHVLEISSLRNYLSQHRININLRQVYDSASGVSGESVVN
jgi:alkylated DNA repair protein alkB homolog 1